MRKSARLEIRLKVIGAEDLEAFDGAFYKRMVVLSSEVVAGSVIARVMTESGLETVVRVGRVASLGAGKRLSMAGMRSLPPSGCPGLPAALPGPKVWTVVS